MLNKLSELIHALRYVLFRENSFKRFSKALFVILFACVLPTWAFDSSYEVTDSFGKYKFERPPLRVVVTDWTLLEQLLELGVKPIAAPELDLYRRYVVQPNLPEDIVDIGLRRAPNIETIRALKPDVIILGTDQKKLAHPFSRISRVMFYNSFSDKYRTNGKKSRERFLQIAELFQLTKRAEEILSKRDVEISEIKEELNQHFNGDLPKLTIIRFANDEKTLIYGENSIVLHTMLLLGLSPTLQSSRSKWGEKLVPLKQLNGINEGVLLYIEPVESNKVFASEAWLSLPMVQQKKVAAMPAVWSYGGAMSVLYNARAIRDALFSFTE